MFDTGNRIDTVSGILLIGCAQIDRHILFGIVIICPVIRTVAAVNNISTRIPDQRIVTRTAAQFIITAVAFEKIVSVISE